MLRRHVLPIALLAVLVVAPAAGAKQINGLTACGADGCKSVSRAVGQAMHDIGGPAIAGSPKPGPYFRLVMHVGDGTRSFGTSRLLYIPSSRTLGNDGGWSRVAAGPAGKLDRALAGRSPLPAAGLEAASAKLAPPPESRPPEVYIPALENRSAVADGGGGTAWWVIGAGVLTVAALLLALLRLRRERLTLAQH